MDFCQKCSSVMMPHRKGKKVVLICRRCGVERIFQKKSFKIAEHLPKEENSVVVVEKEFLSLPKTKIPCPKCNYIEAHWWLQQTRSADEAPTLFFRCVKCNYSWRQYS